MIMITDAGLSTYLGAPVDAARANQLIGWAQSLCESVVNPLPAGAEAVLLDVVARAYVNPAAVAQESEGPFSRSFGSVSGGLWLTDLNLRTLWRLAGSGGAFTIDMTPAGAMQGITSPYVDPGWDVQ